MNYIVLFAALPFLSAFLIPILRKVLKDKPLDILPVGVTLALSGMSAYMAFFRPEMPLVYQLGGWKIPFGISWLLDPLSLFMLVVVNVITFFVTVYSVNYMEQYTAKWKYYTLLMLMLGGLNSVVLAADIFDMYVFIEIAAVASYALVAFGTKTEEVEASFKYMVLGSIASAFILLGITFLYAKTSTLNMFDMASALSAQGASGNYLLFVSALFITGLGLKAALVPFHAWLPDAHPAAPAPISAMLSGLVIKTIGVYALVRIFFNVFQITPVTSELLLALGGLSMFVGVILAIGQWDFKRLLAYHSISQIGYVVCGIAVGTPLGIAGGLFHLMNHSVFKGLLFLNAGSVEYATGTRDLKQLSGLQEKMPHTSWTSLVASLSIAGVPPFCGFWSKLLVIFALFQAGRPFYGSLGILVGLITLGSFLKIQKYVFYRKIKEALNEVREVPALMCASMAALAVFCLVLGIWFKPVLDDMLMPAAEVLAAGKGYFLALTGK
ncbi:MAG: NADH/ubiquinone/plastoquinone (complex I) [Candidatus Omnitrophica bacterium]|nr:NADH/ubiquinone/plastoquinone (complex I) [Candidatus Omnitrophota bacterium]